MYSKSKIELSSDNKAIIPVHLSHKEAALSDYGAIGHPVINSEFASFLEQHILATHLLHDISIEVESEQFTSKDIEGIKGDISNDLFFDCGSSSIFYYDCFESISRFVDNWFRIV